MHSTCIVRVQSLPRPTTVMISTHFHRTRLQTFLKLVAVSSVYMLQDVRCLDEKPMHFGISIHLQLGGARRKSGETTSPQTKYNSFKYPKTQTSKCGSSLLQLFLYTILGLPTVLPALRKLACVLYCSSTLLYFTGCTNFLWVPRTAIESRTYHDPLGFAVGGVSPRGDTELHVESGRPRVFGVNRPCHDPPLVTVVYQQQILLGSRLVRIKQARLRSLAVSCSQRQAVARLELNDRFFQPTKSFTRSSGWDSDSPAHSGREVSRVPTYQFKYLAF